MSNKSPAERLQARMIKAQADEERRKSANDVHAEHRKVVLARDEKTERLKAMRLAAQNVQAAAPASDKRAKRTLRPGQTANTRRAISG